MGAYVRVVVHDSRIHAMSLPGGNVYRYAKKRTRRVTALAKEFAPVRSGALRRSVREDVRPLARDMVVGRVRAGNAAADYAGWVHEGTHVGDPFSPSIFPRKKPYLLVPKSRGSGFKIKRYGGVRGQDANPFLTRALAAEMAGGIFGKTLLKGNPFG